MSPIEMSLPDRRLILRYAPALFVLVSAALLLTVYLFQHIGGLQPCPLCVAQRYPHFAVLGLGLAALVFSGRVRWLRPALLGAIVIAYLVGAGYAAFHVGVEGGHFQSGCAGAGGAASSIEELRARITEAPLVRCDDVAWTLFGVSMAGWTASWAWFVALSAGYHPEGPGRHR
jgi:disulfide bond formation protein DsbB